jgi:general nucleoside transport system permease protein
MKKINFAAILGLVVGLFLCSVMVLFFNESPIHFLQVLARSFYQSKFDMGLTLYYVTVLIFSGLAFSIPFKAGLFNLGVEGQILLTAMIAAVIGQSAGIHYLSVIVLTLVLGLISSWIVAGFKAFRNSHEVVVAIMLNFIFAALASYVVLNYYQNSNSQNPESSLVNESLQGAIRDPLKVYFDGAPVSSFLIIAVLCSILVWLMENKTKWGLEIVAFGENPAAAERAGISSKKIIFLVLSLAGVFSALIGLTEILGNTFQYKIGFSASYGFLGIVVALLAQGNPIGIIFSSLVISILHKGASDLDLETMHLTRDYSKVIQAIIILSVGAAVYFEAAFKRFFRKVLGK